MNIIDRFMKLAINNALLYTVFRQCQELSLSREEMLMRTIELMVRREEALMKMATTALSYSIRPITGFDLERGIPPEQNKEIERLIRIALGDKS